MGPTRQEITDTFTRYIENMSDLEKYDFIEDAHAYFKDWCVDEDDEGYDAGFEDGRASGYDEGFEDGRDEGYAAGEEVGYDKGYEVGHDEGYEAGKEDGLNESQRRSD